MNMNQENEEKLLSVKEASKFLGISQVTLHRILKRHEIGFFRVGYRILFSKEQHLFPFLQKREVKPSELN
jgi:excisionase family DNA binding protein